ncbi:39S ribosomal protein L11, mitochondrial [Diprion similis]|uniref:39S ribosomal protein L11, mitochondrial n=1 Tax=Diprion similis TaxID=362088 RepID=UPI001EF99DFD|nr:39S ribosomal protein L11, mitochondrial [Diprion similis]
MSRAGGKLKSMRKAVAKVDHSSKLKTDIPAGMAMPSPPLGPVLGQRNINIAAFCKDFNERTKDIKEGIPLPCRVRVTSDRTYDLVIHKPPATFYLKQAAGIQRGAMHSGQEVAGKITLKHLYEIAKIKSEDPSMALMDLKQICQMFVGVARSCGIRIVRELDPVEYGQFLEERKLVIEEQKRELQEKKEARMLRTA